MKRPLQKLEIFLVNIEKKVICQGVRRSNFEKMIKSSRSLQMEGEWELTKDLSSIVKYLAETTMNL